MIVTYTIKSDDEIWAPAPVAEQPVISNYKKSAQKNYKIIIIKQSEWDV